jgi:urease accessory protein
MSPALLLLADGRFPAGGHANSAGTESAVRFGIVHDEASLERFLRGRLETTGVVDAAFAAAAAAAVARPHELDAEYDARMASPRGRAVSRQMGRQLLRAAHAVWPHCPIGDHHQPVALGLACAAAGGTPSDAAAVARHHLAAAICTAAVRMLGLDPLRVAAIQARTTAAVELPSEPGVLPALTTTLTEILAEEHGHWDARLFVA